MSQLFRGTVALVTGGTSGIGQATALAFARGGARVVLAARRVDRGEATVALVRRVGGQAIFVQTDVEETSDIANCINQAVEAYGRLDYLVNNAGQASALAPTADQIEDTGRGGAAWSHASHGPHWHARRNSRRSDLALLGAGQLRHWACPGGGRRYAGWFWGIRRIDMQYTDDILAQRKTSSSAWGDEGPSLAVADQTAMAMPAAGDYVTLVEVLEIIRPLEEFAAAAQAATQRLEREGVQALVRIHFYARPGSAEVGAILTFSDRERMIEHINLISAWDEFKAFFGMVRPLDVRVYGQLSAEAAAWIRQFGEQVISRTFERHVAGFVRPHG